MSNPKTAEQWLNVPKLPTELGRVLVPGPWVHSIYCNYQRPESSLICTKCKTVVTKTTSKYVKGVPGRWVLFSDEPCSVPGPITIDWNTAMEWRDKADGIDFINAMYKVYEALDSWKIEDPVGVWAFACAQPKHYLIAAAMSMESKDNVQQ